MIHQITLDCTYDVNEETMQIVDPDGLNILVDLGIKYEINSLDAGSGWPEVTFYGPLEQLKKFIQRVIPDDEQAEYFINELIEERE